MEETLETSNTTNALIKMGLVLSVGLSAYLGAPLAYDKATAYLQVKKYEAIEWLRTREDLKPYLSPLHELDLQTALKAAARNHQVPYVALRAIADAESSGGKKLYRFEPDVFNRLSKISKASEDERRMLASSHGVMHVMGFNAWNRCGIDWNDLYNREKGIDCGAKILAQNLETYSGKKRAVALRLALRDYNGSGDRAEAYADKVMGKIGEYLFEESL